MGKRKPTAKRSLSTSGASLTPRADALLGELRGLISGTRDRVASAVNALLALLYWQIGHRFRTECRNIPAMFSATFHCPFPLYGLLLAVFGTSHPGTPPGRCE